MKYPDSPQGRVYKIKPRAEQTPEVRLQSFHDNDIVDLSFYTVLVVGKSDTHKGCWRISPVINKMDPTLDTDLQVPIRPAKKDKKTNMRLRFCHHDPLNLVRVWVNLHEIYEVNRCVFEDTGVELQLRSNNGLVHFMKLKGVK